MYSDNLSKLLDSGGDDEIEPTNSVVSMYTKMPEPEADDDPATLDGLRREMSEMLRPKLKELREKEQLHLRQAALEALAWDQDYRLTPRGEIAVAELLQVIFMFLHANLTTLLCVSSVSRAWRERATYLPQWSHLGLRFPSQPPPLSIRNGPRQIVPPSDEELSPIPCVTTVALSREIYFSYLWRNQEHFEQRRSDYQMEKVRRVKDRGCAFVIGVGGPGSSQYFAFYRLGA
jgi:hypothetical protein